MPERYVALGLHVTGRFAPSQWEVAALPRPLYVRYRWGILTVREDWGDELGPILLEQEHGDPFSSEMDTPTMQQLTAEVIDWSACRW